MNLSVDGGPCLHVRRLSTPCVRGIIADHLVRGRPPVWLRALSHALTCRQQKSRPFERPFYLARLTEHKPRGGFYQTGERIRRTTNCSHRSRRCTDSRR